MTWRYSTDSTGHVWILPAEGAQGKAREFRTYAQNVQERVIDDAQVIKWVMVRRNMGKTGAIEKCPNPRNLQKVIERIHRAYLANQSEYLRQSKGY